MDSQIAPIGGEFGINDPFCLSRYADLASSAITALTDGGFVVTWHARAYGGASYGVYAQRYDKYGAKDGEEFKVSTENTVFLEFPAITALTDGAFVVTWQSYGQDGSLDGVFAQRYDRNGASEGGEFQINSFYAGDQKAPAISTVTNSSFAVAVMHTTN